MHIHPALCRRLPVPDMCSSSYLPLAVDDPKSKNVISDLVISLFNGAKAATMKHGESVPTSMAVLEQEK